RESQRESKECTTHQVRVTLNEREGMALVFGLMARWRSAIGLLGQSDEEAECGETLGVSLGSALRIASVVEVGSEIFVGSIGRENVENDHEDLSRESDDGFVLADAALESQKAHAEEAVFLA